ncbi:MAG TPA: hypothetical protein VIH90_05365 [Candidatus Saccharimonadales bacterium]
MTIWWLALIIAAISFSGVAFIWLAIRVGSSKNQKSTDSEPSETVGDAPERNAGHIFNEEFQEELRNRGRLHFEKIINESSMFLQQDLRLTTSQLNEYMKTEITSKLQDEFAKYEQSINDAKQLAIESIKKTNAAIDEQRSHMSEQIKSEIVAEKGRLIERFEQNMTDIVNHYLVAAIGNQIDLNDQLEYILSDFEENKKAIIEDIKNGS